MPDDIENTLQKLISMVTRTDSNLQVVISRLEAVLGRLEAMEAETAVNAGEISRIERLTEVNKKKLVTTLTRSLAASMVF